MPQVDTQVIDHEWLIGFLTTHTAHTCAHTTHTHTHTASHWELVCAVLFFMIIIGICV